MSRSEREDAPEHPYRGGGGANGGYDRECPFCGAQIGEFRRHLPCEGVEDGDPR